MGATYAGVLGPMASMFVLLRAIKSGGNAESALLVSALALLAFAAIGYLVGRIAQQTIEESVHLKYHGALSDIQDGPKSGAKSGEKTTSD